MMAQADDKASVEYQRLTWDALRKSINGLVNKVSAVPVPALDKRRVCVLGRRLRHTFGCRRCFR